MPGDLRRRPPDRDALGHKRIGLARVDQPASGISPINEGSSPLAAADLDCEIERAADQGPPQVIAPRSRVDPEIPARVEREDDPAPSLDRLDAEIVVSASTLTRMSQGRRPDVDGLAALLAWSGLDVAAFIRSNRTAQTPATLTRITTELRADPQLSDESSAALEDIVRTAYRQLAARDARAMARSTSGER